MKTSELEGTQLDYWVARAEGKNVEIIYGHCVHPMARYHDEIQYEMYKPSFDWTVGGPLIEKYIADLTTDGFTWHAVAWKPELKFPGEGAAPLQAICRAIVRAKFGDEVPDA